MPDKRPKLKQLETAYKKAIRISRECNRALLELNELEEEIFGFCHNDKDMDDVIDTVEYATGSLSFERYLKRMEEEVEVNGD